ncbi:MAG: DUF1573 domain-containing protein [Acidobacteriota bacterium]
MKKLLIIIFFIMLTFTLSADAILKFKEKVIDFGEVKSGKVVDLKFEFENAGDSLLIIKNVNTTCGCTVTRLEQKEYEPGAKGVIPLKFFSKGYRGKIIKSVNVFSNDQTNPNLRLTLKGIVKIKDFAVADIETDTIDFSNIFIGDRPVKEVEIKNSGNIDLRILDITHSPEVSTEFDKKLVKPGEIAKLLITLNPYQPGHISTFLRVRTNALKRPLLILRLKADIAKKPVE